MTETLTLLDKKILTELNLDVRASYSKIAKKVRSSKEVVNYRIKRLEKLGIIKGYVTIFGLGYWANKILLSFSKIDEKKEKKIIEYLGNHNNINWLTSCSGDWDLVFSIMSKNPLELDNILREIFTYVGEYVNDYKISTSVGSNTFGHTYILSSVKEPEKIKRNIPEKLDFDSKDKKIARELRSNARAKLIDIHTKTKIPIDTIKYRIKKMQENSIIKRYRLILDPTKLGYNRYEVFLRCINLSDNILVKLKDFAKNNSNIEYFSKCVGSWDIEFTVHLKSSSELRDFIIEVKARFGEYIKKFEIINLFDTYNFVHNPDEII